MIPSFQTQPLYLFFLFFFWGGGELEAYIYINRERERERESEGEREREREGETRYTLANLDFVITSWFFQLIHACAVSYGYTYTYILYIYIYILWEVVTSKYELDKPKWEEMLMCAIKRVKSKSNKTR